MKKINIKYIPSEGKIWVHRYITPMVDVYAPLNKMFNEIFWK